MIIILEGLDRTGKSTQAQKIKKFFSEKYDKIEIIHDKGVSGKPSLESSKAHYEKMLATLTGMHDKNTLLIYDRFHLGESVYPRLYKGYDGLDTFEYVDEYLKNNFLKDTLLFLFYDTPEKLIGRDDNKSLAKSTQDIEDEITAFKNAFNRSYLKKVDLNIADKNIDDVFEVIKKYISLYLTDNNNEQTLYDDFVLPLKNNLTNNKILKNNTVELLNATARFKPTYVFDLGKHIKTNVKYCKQELDWYNSQSLSIKGYVDNVKIWRECASKDDKMEVNSNYGYLVFGEGNGSQFMHALNHLLNDETSRNAVIIYNRPSIHDDMHENGKHDMICTMYSQFFIRENKLYMKNDMRSNDLVFGFLNDFFWASKVYHTMYDLLQDAYPTLEFGDIFWNCSSLHVYERHFNKLRNIDYFE